MTPSVPTERSWRKSSQSSANSACVEVAVGPAAVGARDSKHPAPTLTFARDDWATFLRRLGR